MIKTGIIKTVNTLHCKSVCHSLICTRHQTQTWGGLRSFGHVFMRGNIFLGLQNNKYRLDSIILPFLFVLWVCVLRVTPLLLLSKFSFNSSTRNTHKCSKVFHRIMLCFKKVTLFQIALLVVALVLTFLNIRKRFFTNEVKKMSDNFDRYVHL